MKFNELLNKYMNLINCNSKTLAKEALLSETAISRYKKGLRGNELIKPLTPMNKPRKEWDKINENLRKSTKITN